MPLTHAASDFPSFPLELRGGFSVHPSTMRDFSMESFRFMHCEPPTAIRDLMPKVTVPTFCKMGFSSC